MNIECIKCGAENSSGEKFCRGCGAEFEVVAPSFSENIIACAKCNHASQLGKKFCEKCGSPLMVPTGLSNASVGGAPYSQHPVPRSLGKAVPAQPTASYTPNVAGMYQPAANAAKSTMIIGVVAAMLALGGLGWGGYWYYQQVEAEKAVALQRQQEEVQRLKAEAEASAEEALRVAAQQAREEVQRNADAERQALQAQADAAREQQQALLNSQVRVSVPNEDCYDAALYIDGTFVGIIPKDGSRIFSVPAGTHSVKFCSVTNSNSCGSVADVNWMPGEAGFRVSRGDYCR